jgi:hypothetical protein
MAAYSSGVSTSGSWLLINELYSSFVTVVRMRFELLLVSGDCKAVYGQTELRRFDC